MPTGRDREMRREGENQRERERPSIRETKREERL
jgi:hypothetical protein